MSDSTPIGKNPKYKRIATEEAWGPTRMLDMYRDLYESRKLDDPGFDSLWGFYSTSDASRPRFIREKMADLGAGRIADMDAAGIDHAVLALTSPGVQVFDRDTAVGLARDTNDEVAEAVRNHPDRFSAVAAIAPQAPELAGQELERCKKLGLKGFTIHSHTFGEYLDQDKFLPIFEAAEALDMPLYLHPYTPPKDMIRPFLERGLDGAIFGFGVETGLHALRMMVGGVFDRFPRFTLILGHMGEALPYWMYRLDYMHDAGVKSRRYESMKPLQRKISDYMKENVYVTNSGVAWEPAIKFCQQVLGSDRVMYAMDYPYQYSLDEVRALDAMDMSDADKKMFFQDVAEKVFKLK